MNPAADEALIRSFLETFNYRKVNDLIKVLSQSNASLYKGKSQKPCTCISISGALSLQPFEQAAFRRL
jgi:hypothetical protein